MNASILIGIGIAVLVALAAVAITIVLVLKSTKKKPAATIDVDVPLEQWLAQWGGRMPVDAALALLRGALTQLAQAHDASITHGCVHPGVIVVAANGTTKLMAPTGAQPAAYQAPELAQGEAATPQSDVYALAVVLYRMVAGEAPADAEQRAQGMPIPTIDTFGASEAQAVAIYNALSPNAAIRPRTAGALAAALGLDLAAAVPQAATVVEPVLPTAAAPAKSRTGMLIALVAASAVVLIGILVIGVFGYFTVNYNAAEQLTRDGKYTEALGKLKQAPDWFRDTKLFASYIKAHETLLDRNYNVAGTMFDGLGDYRDSKEMKKEAEYEQGADSLQSGNLELAANCFTELADLGYKDSADRLKEAHYQQGVKALDAGDLDGAQAKLQPITGYKDTDSLLNEVKYRRGKQALDAGDVATAMSILQTIPSYKDAASLLNDASYLQAKAYVDAKQYDQAKPLVDALVAAGYSKAQDLQNELNYQQALALYDGGKYSDAMALFASLGNYQDAEQFILECKAGILKQAVDFYHQSDYSSAKTALDSIGDFDNSKAYQTLIAAHLASGLSHDDMQSLCDAVAALGDFEDAVDLVNSDAFIEYRLFGRWTDAAGKYFEMTVDTSTGGWHIRYNIPWTDGKFYKIEGGILYLGSDEDGWNKVFGLGVSANNTLDVYCYKDGITYTLVKQQ